MLKRNLLLVICLLIGVATLWAQESIVKFEAPVETSGSSVPADKAVLTIVSPNVDLVLEGNLYGDLMGGKTEYVTGERRKVGSEYHYVLAFSLHPDLDMGGTHVETLTISNAYGSKDCKLALKMGKSYIGRFEIPVELICLDEGMSVYAASNAARLRFLSDILDELTIGFNGETLFEAGKVATSLPSYVTSARLEGDAVVVDFNTASPEALTEAFQNPRLTARTENGESLSFTLADGNRLENKRSYQFRILRQVTKIETVQKDLTFAETLAQADALAAKYDFEAAANMYQEAMNKVDCPLDQKESIRGKQVQMKKARRMDYLASWAEANAERVGVEHDSAYHYYNGARGTYVMLSKMFPERAYYKEKAEALEQFVTDHFKDSVNKTVTKQNQVITGKVTLAKGFIGSVAGVHIYEAPTSKAPKKASEARKDYRCIGKTDADGRFRLVIEHDHPVRYLYFYRDEKVVPITGSTKTLDVVLGEK